MTDKTRKLNVFLCHSENDKLVVQELFARLVKEGFEPWMESESIYPGEDRELAIEKAMSSCDIILLCISKFTLSAEGTVQKRMRRAIDIQAEKLPGSIFLIPVRLEDCKIPDYMQLHKIQSADYFSLSGIDKLVESLLKRAEELHLLYDRIANYNPNLRSDDAKYLKTRSELSDEVNEIVTKLTVLNMIEEKRVVDARLLDERRKKLLDQAISIQR